MIRKFHLTDFTKEDLYGYEIWQATEPDPHEPRNQSTDDVWEDHAQEWAKSCEYSFRAGYLYRRPLPLGNVAGAAPEFALRGWRELVQAGDEWLLSDGRGWTKVFPKGTWVGHTPEQIAKKDLMVFRRRVSAPAQSTQPATEPAPAAAELDRHDGSCHCKLCEFGRRFFRNIEQLPPAEREWMDKFYTSVMDMEDLWADDPSNPANQPPATAEPIKGPSPDQCQEIARHARQEVLDEMKKRGITTLFSLTPSADALAKFIVNMVERQPEPAAEPPPTCTKCGAKEVYLRTQGGMKHWQCEKCLNQWGFQSIAQEPTLEQVVVSVLGIYHAATDCQASPPAWEKVKTDYPETRDCYFRIARWHLAHCAAPAAAPEPPPAKSSGLTFADAVKIARGCTDYGGGYHEEPNRVAFQHGIRMVLRSLEWAQKHGLKDTQVAALHSIGAAPKPHQCEATPTPEFLDLYQQHEVELRAAGVTWNVMQ